MLKQKNIVEGPNSIQQLEINLVNQEHNKISDDKQDIFFLTMKFWNIIKEDDSKQNNLSFTLEPTIENITQVLDTIKHYLLKRMGNDLPTQKISCINNSILIKEQKEEGCQINLMRQDSDPDNSRLMDQSHPLQQSDQQSFRTNQMGNTQNEVTESIEQKRQQEEVERINRTWKEVESLQSRIKELQSQNEDLSSSLKDLYFQHQALQSSYQDLQLYIQSNITIVQQTLELTLGNLPLSLQNKDYQLEFSIRISERQEENHNEQQTNQTINEFQIILSSLDQQKIDIDRRRKIKNKRIQDLENNNQLLMEEIHNGHIEHKTLKDNYHQAQEQFWKLKGTIDTIRSTIDTEKYTKTILDQQYIQLTQEVQNLNKVRQEIMKSNEELTEQVKIQQKNVEELVQESTQSENLIQMQKIQDVEQTSNMKSQDIKKSQQEFQEVKEKDSLKLLEDPNQNSQDSLVQATDKITVPKSFNSRLRQQGVSNQSKQHIIILNETEQNEQDMENEEDLKLTITKSEIIKQANQQKNEKNENLDLQAIQEDREIRDVEAANAKIVARIAKKGKQILKQKNLLKGLQFVFEDYTNQYNESKLLQVELEQSIQQKSITVEEVQQKLEHQVNKNKALETSNNRLSQDIINKEEQYQSELREYNKLQSKKDEQQTVLSQIQRKQKILERMILSFQMENNRRGQQRLY